MGGKTIHSQARTLALKVLKFFEDEKSNKKFIIPVDQAFKRASAATGLSKATLMRIKNEAKKAVPISQDQSDDEIIIPDLEPRSSTSATPEPKLSTPGKKWKTSAIKVELDHFDLCALKDLVDNFYTVRKEIPTLQNILAAAQADLHFSVEETTLREILVNILGYKFKKCKNKREFYIYREDKEIL